MPQKISEGLDGNGGTGNGFFTGEAMVNFLKMADSHYFGPTT